MAKDTEPKIPLGNQPAFPCVLPPDAIDTPLGHKFDGLTKREFIAAAVCSGAVHADGGICSNEHAREIACMGRQVADALLAELEKPR